MFMLGKKVFVSRFLLWKKSILPIQKTNIDFFLLMLCSTAELHEKKKSNALSCGGEFFFLYEKMVFLRLLSLFMTNVALLKIKDI